MVSGFSASNIFGKVGEGWESRTSYYKGCVYLITPWLFIYSINYNVYRFFYTII